MSSPLITWIAAAASRTGSACFIVDVTLMRDSSSIDSRLSDDSSVCGAAGVWPCAGPAPRAARNTAMAPGGFFMN